MTVNHNLDRSNIRLAMKEGEVDSESNKLGSFIGDNAQVGASNTLAAGAVIAPGQIVPHHHTYPVEGD